MRAKVAGKDLRIARLNGLEYGIVYEYVLVLRLNHVVTLGSQTRHVTIDIDCVDMFYPL